MLKVMLLGPLPLRNKIQCEVKHYGVFHCIVEYHFSHMKILNILKFKNKVELKT